VDLVPTFEQHLSIIKPSLVLAHTYTKMPARRVGRGLHFLQSLNRFPSFFTTAEPHLIPFYKDNRWQGTSSLALQIERLAHPLLAKKDRLRFMFEPQPDARLGNGPKSGSLRTGYPLVHRSFGAAPFSIWHWG